MRTEVLALAASGACSALVLSGVYFGYGKSRPRLLLEDSSGPQQEEGDSEGASSLAAITSPASRRDRLGGGVAQDLWSSSGWKDWPVCFEFKVLRNL